MKGLLLSAWILLSTLLAKAQTECPPGFRRVEDPPGNFNCVKIDDSCPGTNRDYHDTVGGDLHCCNPSSRALVIYDEVNRVGVCCAVGQVYAGNAPNGLCCNPGQIVKDGKCTDPPPPGPPTGCPAQPSNACRMKKVCGNADASGLQYGTCYQISFPTGKQEQLGRGYLDTNPHRYRMGGNVQNIPFKICKTPTACGTGPVAAGDTFAIQDQLGLTTDAASAKVWNNAVTTNAAAPVYMVGAADGTTAGRFKGQTSCSGCKCVVSLTGATNGLTLRNENEATSIGLYGLTFIPNKNAFVDLQFSEIPCDNSIVYSDVGAAPAAKVALKSPAAALQVEAQDNDSQIPIKA
ncbi:hypothetical protein V5O48_004980 [Marasmius crinis-equi]|uniref:Uncharacterized protein n=1 Tax=Marasmius crinis-equi TaxID=585013 RepID=A0ABR3FNL4_9AGAR